MNMASDINSRIALKAASLPSAVTFSFVVSILLFAVIFALFSSESLLSRLEEREQASSAIHAACMLYGGGTEPFDSMSVQPFQSSCMVVRESKGMHGLYGELAMEVPMKKGAAVGERFLTGMAGLPDGDCALYVPDYGVTLTIGDDCSLSAPLAIPGGYFRRMNTGGHALDSLTVRPSGEAMPELSAAAYDILERSWHGAPEEIVLSGDCEGVDSLVWALRVVVDSTFRGCAQVFARDSAIVEDGATMAYPSGVCLVSDDDGSGIRIGADAIVEGYAVVLDRGDLAIKPGARVRGLVYTPGSVCLEGAVTGTVYAGMPVCSYGWTARQEYMLSHTVINANDVLAYPELFSWQGPRTVIRRMRQ